MFISRSNLKNLFFYVCSFICGIFVFDYLLINNLYAVSFVTGSYSADLPRDLSKNEFVIKFTLNFSSTEGTNLTSDTVYKNIKIKFPNYKDHVDDLIPDSDNGDIHFTKSLKEEVDIFQKKEGDGYQATVKILIKGTTSDNLKEIKGDTNEYKIRVIYNDTELTPDIIAISPSPINAAPELTAIQSGFRSVRVDWNVPQNVLPHIKEGEKSIPASMDIILIKKDQLSAPISIPAKKYAPDKPTDEDVFCTINDISAEENTLVDCNISCGDDNVYLDTSSKGTQYQITRDVSISKGSTTLGGLEVNTQYVIFAQYQPSGVQRSQCGIVTPYTNYSFSEFYEETTSKEKDLNCFIATAAYGSAFTKELKILRWFRDTYLKSNSVGKKLVNLYYKYSPSVAKKIQDSPILAKITRTLLYIPVGISYLLFLLNPTSPSVIGLVILMIILGLSTLMIRKLYKKD